MRINSKHTATHCNTLQHTTTHRNTLTRGSKSCRPRRRGRGRESSATHLLWDTESCHPMPTASTPSLISMCVGGQGLGEGRGGWREIMGYRIMPLNAISIKTIVGGEVPFRNHECCDAVILKFATVCCSVLQCVAVCCSVLQCVAVCSVV